MNDQIPPDPGLLFFGTQGVLRQENRLTIVGGERTLKVSRAGSRLVIFLSETKTIRDSVEPVAGRGWVLLEAVCWTLGVLLAQGLVLVFLMAVMLTATFGWPWPSRETLLTWVLETDLDRSFLLVGVPVLGAIFLILPAIRWREGKEFRQHIGWRMPQREEVVYSLAMIAPVALIGDVVYDVMNSWWQRDHTLWPFATVMGKTSLDHLYRTFPEVSYPALVVALALAPAVVEELVFRGMLGRKLVERFGMVYGVLIASGLFAAIHGSFPHAVATLPIAVLLHVLYLQTGTIWIPILVHFGNNLLAISMVHFQLGIEGPVSAQFLGIICGYLGLLLFLLQSRTHSVPASGSRYAM